MRGLGKGDLAMSAMCIVVAWWRLVQVYCSGLGDYSIGWY